MSDGCSTHLSGVICLGGYRIVSCSKLQSLISFGPRSLTFSLNWQQPRSLQA
jgi:hypothetical protein